MTKKSYTETSNKARKVNLQSVKALFLFLIAMMTFPHAFAQSQIISFGQFAESNYAGRARAIALATELQTAVYVENGEMNVYGDSPVCLYTDPESLTDISKFNIPSADIEMIIVKISAADQLKRTIDFAPLSLYPKLKYIFISASIEMTEKSIRQFVTGAHNYIFIYKTAKNS